MTDDLNFVYLASPVDLSSASPDVLEFVNSSLSQVPVYNPAKAWSVPSTVAPSPRLQQINMQALRRCSTLVGVVAPGPSLGVPSEIILAIKEDIPVVLFVDQAVYKRSWFLSWLLDQEEVLGAFVYRMQEDQLVVDAISDSFTYFSAASAHRYSDVSPEDAEYLITSSMDTFRRLEGIYPSE